MKKVFIRVGTGFAEYEAAEKRMQSLGYVWLSGEMSLAKYLGGWNSKILFGNRDRSLTHSGDDRPEKLAGYEEIFLPPTKHKHHDLIVKWAADPSQKVWRDNLQGGWVQMTNPSWNIDAKYHIGEQPPKRKIMIGDVEIDAPEQEFLNYGESYFVVTPSVCDYKMARKWIGCESDKNALKRGLIHLNKEAAIAHAKALIKISGGCVDGQ